MFVNGGLEADYGVAITLHASGMLPAGKLVCWIVALGTSTRTVFVERDESERGGHWTNARSRLSGLQTGFVARPKR
jgi:hypothetical protein